MNESKFKEKGYFEFPFKPYDIQENFMKHLYYTIENEKIGIFESPTGTVRHLLIFATSISFHAFPVLILSVLHDQKVLVCDLYITDGKCVF